MQASRLKEGNTLTDLTRIKPINEKNIFNGNKASHILAYEGSHSYHEMTRIEKLARRAEEIKCPQKDVAVVQPIVQQPSSQHSVHSKLPQPPAPEPIINNPRENPQASYSRDERRFFGVSSQCSNKMAPVSKRSEIKSKGSSKKDINAKNEQPSVNSNKREYYNQPYLLKLYRPPKTSYEIRTGGFSAASQGKIYPQSHASKKY